MEAALASKILPIEITTLQDEASFIGELFIVESKLYNPKQPYCGIKHTARITYTSKGDVRSGATIKFISGQSISVGNSYIIFLNQLSANQLNNLVSNIDESLDQCFQKSENIVSYGRLANFEVVHYENELALFNTQYFILPRGVEVKELNGKTVIKKSILLDLQKPE